MNSPSLLLGVFDSYVNELGVLGVLDSGKDERRVGGSILRLVSSDSYKRRMYESATERRRFQLERLAGNSHSKSPESETTVVNCLS